MGEELLFFWLVIFNSKQWYNISGFRTRGAGLLYAITTELNSVPIELCYNSGLSDPSNIYEKS